MTETEQTARRRNEELFRLDFAENRPVARCKPIQIDFETTTRCNLRCFTCPKTYTRDKGADSPVELFDKTADALFETAASINLTGFGEPMISPHFAYFYTRSVEAGLDVGFVSNGTCFDERWMERFSADPVHLFVSVDAADAATMKIMRPQLDFEKFRRNIELYGSIRERAGAAHRARLYFQFVPTLHNLDSLPEVIEWAARAGASRVEVFSFRTQGLDEEAVRQHISNAPGRAQRIYEAARQTAEHLDMPLVLPAGVAGELTSETAGETAGETCAPTRTNPSGAKYPLACSAPWFRVSVYINGAVHPCCWYPFAMGNLNQQSFDDIWNGELYQRFRRKINTRFPQLGCKSCPLTWGITAGRPEAIFEREGGLDRAHTSLQRWRRRRAVRHERNKAGA